MNRPENEYRRNRFDIAMHGSAQTQSQDAILRGERSFIHILITPFDRFTGFPWDSLPDGSKVVDVGGGIGAVSLPVAKKFPHLQFIIQDLVTGQTEPVSGLF
jgi:hypothetical protein